MRKLSKTNFVDALMQGSDRFKTIKDMVSVEPVDIFFTDKYSMVSALNYEDKNVAIKVFFDQEEERAVEVIESIKLLSEKDFSFVVKSTYIKNELEIISPDIMKTLFADVIIIDNIYPSIFDYIEMEDEGDSCIISEYVKTVSDIILKRVVFDKISANDFCINSDNEVVISTISNIIYDPIAGANENSFRAYVNFLTGTLLKLIINERIAEEGEGEILFPENNRIFDLRAVDYFLSGEYIDWLLEMMTIIETKYAINAGLLRDSLSSHSTADIIAAFASCLIIGEEANIIHEIEGYDIIGNSCEDRIAVVCKENGLIGYLDFSYNLAIECIYQEAKDFVEGIAVCVKDERYGAINRYGEEILPFKYDKLVWCSERNEFTVTLNGETYTKDRFSITNN